MTSTKPEKTVPLITHSIDAVLDTSHPLPSHPVRPGAHLRPSWIGPPRVVTPALETMKHYVTVEYSSPGLQPPVYVFTSLSDPQWDEVEMHRTKNDEGHHVFAKTFFVEEGEYQYKFRLGSGDWWATDESAPMVDDGFGNKNNFLVVKQEAKTPAQSHTKTNAAETPTPTPIEPSKHIAAPTHDETSASAPLMKHETFAQRHGAVANPSSEREQRDSFTQDDYSGVLHPLLKYETFDTKAENELESNARNDDDSSSSYSDNNEANPHSSPLLRHETFKPSAIVQHHAPLLDHEAIAVDYHHREPENPTTPSRDVSSQHRAASSIPVEADLQDPSLIEFPSDRAGILAHIRRTSLQLTSDETIGHHEDAVSAHSQHSSPTSMSSPSLPRVLEGEDEEDALLEKIREAEEEEYEKEEVDGEKMDPLRPVRMMTPPMTPMEPEDADFEPKVREERIVIEVVDRRRSMLEVLLDRFGKGSSIAVAVGLLVLAAGIASMQYM